jgi:cell division protein FtsB
MPSARSAHAKRPAAGRAAPQLRPRVVVTRRPSRPGIRWDRVGRVALLVVLCGIVLLYVGPARSYFSTMGEAKARRAGVAALAHQNAQLRARVRALRTRAALEREARRLGMVRPGERPYIVQDLPKGPKDLSQ